MMMAAILVGTGIVVELCAVMLAPMGYQDENGFHKLPNGHNDETHAGAQNPS